MIKWMNVALLEDTGDSCSPEGVEGTGVKSWVPYDVRDPDYSLWPEVTLLSLGRRAKIKLFLKVENKSSSIYARLPIEDGEFLLDGQKCPLYPLYHSINCPNLESSLWFFFNPLKCWYTISFNALNEIQDQIPWAPDILFLCHILATFRKSGKEFCAFYTWLNWGVVAFTIENLSHLVNICQIITAPFCNLHEVWSEWF